MKKLALLLIPALLAGLLLVPAFADARDIPEVTEEEIDLLLPVVFGEGSNVAPLSLPAGIVYYGTSNGGQVYGQSSSNALTLTYSAPASISTSGTASYLTVYRGYQTSSKAYRAFAGVAVYMGINGSYSAGDTLTISWSGLTFRESRTVVPNVSSFSYSTSWSSSSSGAFGSRSVYLYDSNWSVIGGPFASSGGEYMVKLPSATTGIYLGYSYQDSYYQSNYTLTSIGLSVICNLNNFKMSVSKYVPPPSPPEYLVPLQNIQNLLTQSNGHLQHISDVDNQILVTLEGISSSVSQPSAMEKFEQNYLEKMEDQLSQVEDMMGPENTALPNGGDFAGFVQDVQDGLGVSGSSFNASEFADATSKFGGAGATGPGGPWEFFSQAVQDSLAGDTSTVGAEDDDYIYAWLDAMQRRYGIWSSSSP